MTSSSSPATPHASPDKSTAETPCPPHIPEKFWDTTTGTVRVDDLAKSYRELERRFTSRQQGSPQTSGDNIVDMLNDTYMREKLLRHLGRPDRPEDYALTVKDPYLTLDPDLNIRLHDLGFTQDQVQAVYDLAVERLVPLVLDLIADHQAERDVARLIAEFGGPKKWMETARQLAAFGEKNLPRDLYDKLSGSYDGIMMVYRLMRGEIDRIPSPETIGQSAGLENLDLNRLRTLMRDPRYWRDHDPKFIDKISAGFTRIYG